MINFETSVRINRSREQVFAVLTDFETYLARWAQGPVAAQRLAGNGGVGSRYLVIAKVGPVTVRSPYEVTGFEPPSRMAGSGVAGPVRFHEAYTLREDGSTTVLTQSISATPRGMFVLVRGLVRRQLQRLIASDLGRFKRLVETER